MKTILRIVIILILSAVISGITWIIVDAGDNSSTLDTGREGNGDRFQQNGELAAGELSYGEYPRKGLGGGRHGEFRESEFSGIETIRNLVIVTILVAAVALIEFLLQRRRKHRLQVSSETIRGESIDK